MPRGVCEGVNVNRRAADITLAAPDGALAYKTGSGNGSARWIYDEVDLIAARRETPESVTAVGRWKSRTQLAVELLLRATESDEDRYVRVAGALTGGQSLRSVFELAQRMDFDDQTLFWLVSESERLKLRARFSGLGWLNDVWLEVDSVHRALEGTLGYDDVYRCTLFRGDLLVADYRMCEGEWRIEQECAETQIGKRDAEPMMGAGSPIRLTWADILSYRWAVGESGMWARVVAYLRADQSLAAIDSRDNSQKSATQMSLGRACARILAAMLGLPRVRHNRRPSFPLQVRPGDRSNESSPPEEAGEPDEEVAESSV